MAGYELCSAEDFAHEAACNRNDASNDKRFAGIFGTLSGALGLLGAEALASGNNDVRVLGIAALIGAVGAAYEAKDSIDDAIMHSQEAVRYDRLSDTGQ
jgi:hypothetical protein